MTQRFSLPTQQKVHELICTVGGYWPPLAAVARLIEELAELTEASQAHPMDKTELGSELADVFIISTCIGNQFCAALEPLEALVGREGSTINGARDETPDRCIVQLLQSAGAIARTINYYEGMKPLKPGESVICLEVSIRRLQRVLIEIALAMELDLLREVEAKLEKASRRDASRFQPRADPITSPVLERFDLIRLNTECVFSANAKVWGSHEWDKDLSFEANVGRSVSDLERFLRAADEEGLDAFVFEVQDAGSGESVTSLARATKRLLDVLSSLDPSGRRATTEDVGSPDWHFSFAGQRLFVITFAPCYPPTSARFAFGAEWPLFLLQPEGSFLNKLNQERTRNSQIHQLIRDRYAANGRPYDLARFGEPGKNEAYRFVKPIDSTSPPVRWWEL